MPCTVGFACHQIQTRAFALPPLFSAVRSTATAEPAAVTATLEAEAAAAAELGALWGRWFRALS